MLLRIRRPTQLTTSLFNGPKSLLSTMPSYASDASLDSCFKKPFVPSAYFLQDQYEKTTATTLISRLIQSGAKNASFLVTDLASIESMYKLWKQELPMVEPFYAVKCNPDPVIVRLLASLGCSFDCATMGEMDLVLNKLGSGLNFAALGKANNSMIYAHPAKMDHMLRYAIENNVGMTVFDGEDELYKIASMEGYKGLKVLLRLTTDDRASVCRFSKKFGCPVAEAHKLLQLAKRLNIQVAGCSFHVGSGCGDPQAYTTALNHCRQVFQWGEELGMQPMTIVDIGGGFPGDTGGYGGANMPTFQELAAAIRSEIHHFCNDWPHRSIEEIRFIAEPGRYFVSASTIIASKVYSRKGGSSKEHQALFLDNGVYGSFNNVVYDHATPTPQKLGFNHSSDVLTELIPTAVFGPTCDGLDQICAIDTTKLPRCEVGDWLFFENCGAYTHTASFVFNGYTHIPNKVYCYSE